MTLPIYIDEVQAKENLIEALDQLEIEWFETQKHLFKRFTVKGIELHLEKKKHPIWQQGDVLYADGKLIAQIVIKPTLTIQFETQEKDLLADFAYYIGNRHLPIFIGEKPCTFLIPYDGYLYEQLAIKFSSAITLIKKQLFPRMLLAKKFTK